MSDSKKPAFTVARWDNVPADDLLEKARRLIDTAGGQPFVAALVFTPAQCIVARVDGDRFEAIIDDKESAIDPECAYEIRIFGEKADLHWVRDGEVGTATLLADGQIDASGAAEWTHGDALETLCRHYYVWGEPPKDENSQPHEKWSLLSAGRIGKIYIPFVAPPRREVVLNAREYVVRDHETGNAVVAFERLVGFAPAPDNTRRESAKTSSE